MIHQIYDGSDEAEAEGKKIKKAHTNLTHDEPVNTRNNNES